MSLDLNAMSKDELLSLKGEVEKALKSLDARRKAEALKAAQDAAKEYGFSLAELTEGGKSSGKKAAPKFANPADPSQTWSVVVASRSGSAMQLQMAHPRMI